MTRRAAPQTPFRLYYFFQRQCGACAEAAPAMRAFRGAHATDGIVTELDAQLRPELLGFRPKGTPAYLLRVGVDEEEIVALKTVGVLTEKELERMLEDARRKWASKFGEAPEAPGAKHRRQRVKSIAEEVAGGDEGDEDEDEEVGEADSEEDDDDDS